MFPSLAKALKPDETGPLKVRMTGVSSKVLGEPYKARNELR